MKNVCVGLATFVVAGTVAGCGLSSAPDTGAFGGKADGQDRPFSTHYLGKLSCEQAREVALEEAAGANAIIEVERGYSDCLSANIDRAAVLQREVGASALIDQNLGASLETGLEQLCEEIASGGGEGVPPDMIRAECRGQVRRIHADMLDGHLQLYSEAEGTFGRMAPIDRRSRSQHLFPSCWQSFDYDRNLDAMERADRSRLLNITDQIACLDNELRWRAQAFDIDASRIDELLQSQRGPFCGHYSEHARPQGQEQSTQNALCAYDMTARIIELFNHFREPRPGPDLVSPHHTGQRQCRADFVIAAASATTTQEILTVSDTYQSCMNQNLDRTLDEVLAGRLPEEHSQSVDHAARFEASFSELCSVLVLANGGGTSAAISTMSCGSLSLELLAGLVDGHLPYDAEGYATDGAYFELLPAERRERLATLVEEVWDEGRAAVILDRLHNGEESAVTQLQQVIATMDDNLRLRLLAGRGADEDLDEFFALRTPFCDLYATRQQYDIGGNYNIANAQCAFDFTLAGLQVVDTYGGAD